MDEDEGNEYYLISSMPSLVDEQSNNHGAIVQVDCICEDRVSTQSVHNTCILSTLRCLILEIDHIGEAPSRSCLPVHGTDTMKYSRGTPTPLQVSLMGDNMSHLIVKHQLIQLTYLVYGMSLQVMIFNVGKLKEMPV